MTPVDHDVVYEAEPTIGYRHFDKHGIEPRFPFGHGMSYTSFVMESVRVEPAASGGAHVAVTVRNTGARPGKEVIQVYVRAPAGVGSGAIELKCFAPVWLGAGEVQTVELDLDRRAFRHWIDGQGWQVIPGHYEVLVGRSSGDLPQRATIVVGA